MKRCVIRFVLMGLLFGAAMLRPVTAMADRVPVDLELVLAVDVSLSMDLDEQQLQREGYVEAFRDREVIDAIRQNGYGRIGVVFVEWAGTAIQSVVMPWTLIDGEAAAKRFADQLEQQPITRARRTSISGALKFAGTLFESSGFQGKRRVVDVSGDGPNNDGTPVEEARDALLAKDITINGLPIMIKRSSGLFDLPNLDQYYESCVIGGFAAFLVTVRDKHEFARAIKRKLLLEIAEQKASVVPTQDRMTAPAGAGGSEAPHRIDCMIGEKRWLDYMDGQRDRF
jgi:hypothetical protein